MMMKSGQCKRWWPEGESELSMQDQRKEEGAQMMMIIVVILLEKQTKSTVKTENQETEGERYYFDLICLPLGLRCVLVEVHSLIIISAAAAASFAPSKPP